MDRVLTVWEYYNGPRTGIAEFRGRPHYFSCQWDDLADEYSSEYQLCPVDDATLAIALEQWAIWQDWERAFHSGQATAESHPAIPGNNARFDELAQQLQAVVAGLSQPAAHLVPSFSADPSSPESCPGIVRRLVVAWSNAA